MATVTEATPGTQDLPTFQTVVQQQEEIFGPLIALWSDGPRNVMEFQVGPSPDGTHRASLITYSDHPPQRDGFSLICVATCLVGGALQQVAAYRKTP